MAERDELLNTTVTARSLEPAPLGTRAAADALDDDGLQFVVVGQPDGLQTITTPLALRRAPGHSLRGQRLLKGFEVGNELGAILDRLAGLAGDPLAAGFLSVFETEIERRLYGLDRDPSTPSGQLLRRRGAEWVAVDADDDGHKAAAAPVLLVHGTFSTPDGAFQALLDREVFADRPLYAFKHLTLSVSPRDNARDLAAAVAGTQLAGRRFDLVSHSRGGLVADALLYLEDHGQIVRPGRWVRVAPPAGGTPLAGPRMHQVASVVLNLLLKGATAGITAALTGLFGPAGTAAAGVVNAALRVTAATILAVIKSTDDPSRLPGLASMAPDKNDFLAELSAARRVWPGAHIHACGANYDGTGLRNLVEWAGLAFFRAGSDLVVPVASMRDAVVGGGWTRVRTRNVHHLNTFEDAQDEALAGLSGALRGETADAGERPVVHVVPDAFADAETYAVWSGVDVRLLIDDPLSADAGTRARRAVAALPATAWVVAHGLGGVLLEPGKARKRTLLVGVPAQAPDLAALLDSGVVGASVVAPLQAHLRKPELHGPSRVAVGDSVVESGLAGRDLIEALGPVVQALGQGRDPGSTLATLGPSTELPSRQAPAPSEWPSWLAPSPGALLDALRRPGAADREPLKISARFSALDAARGVLVVPLFEGQRIPDAVRAVLDARHAGILQHWHDVGLPSAVPGDTTVHLGSGGAGVAIVGLGPPSRRSWARLEHAARMSVLRIALTAEQAHGSAAPLRLSLALPPGVPPDDVGDAVISMLEGVLQAAEQLPSGRRVGAVDVVCPYEDDAIRAGIAVRQLEERLAHPWGKQLELHPWIGGGAGQGYRGSRPISAAGRGLWHRIAIEMDEDGLRFELPPVGGVEPLPEHGRQPSAEDLGAPRESVIAGRTEHPSLDRFADTWVRPSVRRALVDAPNVQLVVDHATARVPWELLPVEGRPIAVRSGLLRRIRGDEGMEIPDATARALVIGNPDGTLPAAGREADRVRAMLGQFNVALAPRMDLYAGGYGILHIAAHGVDGRILLEGGEVFDASSVDQLARVPAVVFLNCCYQEDWALPFNAASTAQRFRERGAQVVIATGWAVGDTSAATFARRFYEAYLTGISLGEAVHLARMATRARHQGDATWAAFQVYGDPHVTWSDEPGAGRFTTQLDREAVSARQLVDELEALQGEVRHYAFEPGIWARVRDRIDHVAGIVHAHEPLQTGELLGRLGHVQLEVGDRVGARETFKRARTQRHSSVSALRIGLFFNRTSPGALDGLRGLACLDPKNARTRSLLAFALLAHGELDEARIAFGGHLPMEPGWIEPTERLGEPRGWQDFYGYLRAVLRGDGVDEARAELERKVSRYHAVVAREALEILAAHVTDAATKKRITAERRALSLTPPPPAARPLHDEDLPLHERIAAALNRGALRTEPRVRSTEVSRALQLYERMARGEALTEAEERELAELLERAADIPTDAVEEALDLWVPPADGERALTAEQRRALGEIEAAPRSTLLQWGNQVGVPLHPQQFVSNAELRKILEREVRAKAFCATDKPRSGSWFNYIGAEQDVDGPTRPAHGGPSYDIIRPFDLGGLERLLDAAAVHKGIRVVGAGHSSSDVARPEVSLFSLDVLRDVGADCLDPGFDVGTWIRGEPVGWKAVRAAAGTRVFELNLALDKLGLGVDQMGSYDAQSLFGALCTGTHGSGASQPPMADYLLSLDMACIIGGKTRFIRAEPAAGPTDRAAFAAEHPTWELVADDDLFNAATVSMGSFGLVFAVTLAVRPQYFLAETRNKVDYDEANLLADVELTRGAKIDSRVQIEWAVNPYGGKIVVTRREVVPRRPSDIAPYEARELPGSLTQMLALGPTRAARLASTPGSLLGRRNFISFALTKAATGDFRSVGYQVLKLGAGRFITAPSCEICVPFARTSEAVAAIRSLANDRGLKFALPYGLRFVRASRAWLAAEYDPDPDALFSLFEISMMLHQDQFREVIHATEAALVPLGGRPHWGQWNHLDRAKIDASWPKQAVDSWVAARQRFDPDGVFDNAFTQRCGL